MQQLGVGAGSATLSGGDYAGVNILKPGYELAMHPTVKPVALVEVDGQDFADIEAYGVQRWLGELALALRPVVALQA